MDIQIELRDRELRAALGRLVAAGADFTPATKAIADHLHRATEEAFQTESDPATGEAWAPLSAVTASQPPDGERGGERGYGSKLKVSTDLLSSITVDWDRSSAVVGSNLVYATTHQFGAKRGEFGSGSYKTRQGSFQIPWGDIPARPFFGATPGDELVITNIIVDHIRSSWEAF